MIRIVILTGIIMMSSVVCCAQPSKKSWHLAWSDEFSYKGLPDAHKWNYDTASDHGWGNNEREYYTYKKLQNVRVENGWLIIEARKEKLDTFNYTPARLLTRGKA